MMKHVYMKDPTFQCEASQKIRISQVIGVPKPSLFQSYDISGEPPCSALQNETSKCSCADPSWSCQESAPEEFAYLREHASGTV